MDALSDEAISALKSGSSFAGFVEAPRKVLRELEKAGLVEVRSDGTRRWGNITGAGYKYLHELRSA